MSNLQYIILMISIWLMPLFCGIVAWRSCRYYDRWKIAEFDRRERLIDERERTFNEVAMARTAELMQQEQEITEKRMELERQLQDVTTLSTATAHQLAAITTVERAIDDDHDTITMHPEEWRDPQ